MAYLKATGDTVEQFPYTVRELRSDNPQVSFPSGVPLDSILAAFNVFRVTQNNDPAFDPLTERLVQGVPVKVSDNWEVTRVVEALTPDEVKDKADDAANADARDKLKKSAEIKALLKKTPAELDTYVDDNVTSLAEAKDLLKVIMRVLSVLAHEALK